MAGEGPAWSTDPGPVVRPYALTRGRTRPAHAMRMHSRLLTLPSPAARQVVTPEARRVVQLCRGHGCAVAEIAATLGRPVHVTKILLSDLIDSNVLMIQPAEDGADPTDPNFLGEILAGLRRLPDRAGT